MEDRVAAQRREIQTLLLDNQRLAATHVALKQDVAAAQDDLRRLSAAASSVKADRDAQVREIYERSLKSEAEARSTDGLPAELGRVRADIKELRAERNLLSDRLTDIEVDIARAQSELRQVPELKSEIEATQRDIQRGRAAIEYERKMHSTNFELSEAMEKHVVSMAREADILRSELANADKSRFDFIRY
ncbi:protein flx-like 1 [Phtheirospermum japonicum]|uniref:Protein flx-like 1 n=1 Tax=Phtheirospermum japonicum TaxID=374723 RepID=A0A830DDS9_9LAMI|nr:protein flx-like 1 [Phtheirospermum japonicum]